MTKRSAITVILLSAVTCGIYAIIWLAATKDEMNQRGANLPSAIHLFIPILGILWIWKWCEAVQKVTGGKVQAGMLMVMMLFIGPVGQYMAQNAFNEVN